MHISHDFIATKTCPSYEYSDRCGFDTKKVRGGRGLVCGVGQKCAGADKISQTPAGAGRV